MRSADLWRRAAGVADYIGQGAPGRHYGRWLCLNCPRDHHEPPFLPFGLQLHIREHWQRFPDHVVAWWCWDHVQVETAYQAGWRWVNHPSLNGDRPQLEEEPMPVYRRVKVSWPDGRKASLLLREEPGEPLYCEPCKMSEATFRKRELCPHDTLDHLEIYFQAKVVRGRRLSERQAANALGVDPRMLQKEEFLACAMPGVLVNVEARP